MCKLKTCLIAKPPFTNPPLCELPTAEELASGIRRDIYIYVYAYVYLIYMYTTMCVYIYTYIYIYIHMYIYNITNNTRNTNTTNDKSNTYVHMHYRVLSRLAVPPFSCRGIWVGATWVIKGIWRQGMGSFCKEFLGFSALPCHHMPLLM